MAAALAADLVLLLHFGFVLFAIFGGVLVLWRRWLAWPHLAAVAWGALIEFFDWTCPLTPLEQALRTAAGETAYAGSFIGHYLVALLYPAGLTRPLQIALGAALLLLNLAVYGWIYHRRGRARR